MSTGTPVSNVETISSNSLGHSRSRGHSRFSRAHAPSPLKLLSVDQPSTPNVPLPVTDTGHLNGHASHASHGHSHIYSHSRSYSNNAASFDDSFHDHGANGKRASGIIGQAVDLKPDPTGGLTEHEAGQNNETVAGFLMTLPWIALSWYANTHAQSTPLDSTDSARTEISVRFDGILERTGIVTAGAMVLIGCAQTVFLHGGDPSTFAWPKLNAKSARMIFLQICAIGLPVYAAFKVGGFLVAFILLLALASGMPTIVQKASPIKASQDRLGQKKFTITLIATAIGLGFLGINTPSDRRPFLGYVALFISVFLLRPPFFGLGQPGAISVGLGLTSTEIPSAGPGDGVLNIISGIFLTFITLIFSKDFSFTALDFIYLSIVAGLIAAPLLYLRPTSMRSPRKFGLAIGAAAAALLCAPPSRDGVFIAYVGRSILAGMSFVTARFDDRHLRLTTNSHHHHVHSDASRITKLIIHYSEPYPLLYSILQESDSRRIFYFMSLNFAFMLVQLAYGFLTGSLGLLSDSIHMFFDCLALIVGLCAAVMSKWPPNSRFPHGYGKVDTLSGFANGIFLMIISIEIIYEAVERLSAGSQMHRISELLVVSIAGLAVNLVGIFAFEHGHHHGHDHGHSHSHGNENMHGIFLHILADTLGSVAVVISTVLVHYSGWAGFDPLASCLIAILIFASAIPLVSSTAKSLLLTLPADVEYNVRDTLAGVSTLRGVAGYTVPKFWLDDTATSSAHVHGHGHDHHHDHDHDHEKHNPHVLGVIHIIASRGADLDDVRQRTVTFLREKNMDILVQVEREGDGRCWCGGGNKSA
ncbi:zinc transporter [Aspergillus sclerotialis]|uniref:Zinc transporter n=1 Tax=Aspergillus sclerotialis TaxID=2070753 RepID=A0A3A2ZUB6_9EURO|nr:zinc transporter [Aspergillus sclerotialis]